MNSVKDKWKKGFQRVLNERDSVPNSNDFSKGATSSTPYEQEKMEVHAYINNMKKKTGLKNLWSGKKFENIVENDVTPDISLDSSNDNFFNSKLKNLNISELDSDEDELRIEYMREMRDENNNDLLTDSISNESLDLMGNIKLAELELNDVSLSGNTLSKEDDYMPIIRHVERSKSRQANSTSSRKSSIKSVSSKKSKSKSELTDSTATAKDVSDISNSSNELEAPYTETSFSGDSYSKTYSKASRNTSYAQSQSLESKSISRTDSNNSKKKQRSRKSHKNRSHTKHSKAKNSRHSSDASHTFDSSSLVSNSTSSSKSRSSNSSKSHFSSDSRKRHSKNSKGVEASRHRYSSKGVSTQTPPIDMTEQVLNFRYAWQNTQPSNIAAHIADEIAIDALTTYSPTVLAANDLMKFHMELLSKHIENSRRLYEAFTSQCGDKNYKYTTVEDTLKYIKRNKPSVISYEKALAEVNGDKVNDFNGV